MICCPAWATQSQASSRGPQWPGGRSKQRNGISAFLGRSLSAVPLEIKDSRPSENPSLDKITLGDVAGFCCACKHSRPTDRAMAVELSVYLQGHRPFSEALAPVLIPVAGLVPAW